MTDNKAKRYLSGQSKVAGVLGWPISHSLSPRLHTYWLDRLHIDGTYIPVPVAPENLELVLHALPAMGFAGVNVTVPHKEAVFRFVDETDDLAWQVGAVNTVDVLPDGRLRGRNTDVYGFAQNLRENAGSFDFTRGPALVLGAGGAARGVIVALAQLDVPEIWITNRSRERAEGLAAVLKNLLPVSVNVIGWEQREKVLPEANMVINTTSLGMKGQPPLDLDLTTVKGGTLVTDIVYSPLETRLLAEANARGLMTVDGLGMLLYQAQPAFATWFGQKPLVDVLTRDMVLATMNSPADQDLKPQAEVPKLVASDIDALGPAEGDTPEDHDSLIDDWLGGDS